VRWAQEEGGYRRPGVADRSHPRRRGLDYWTGTIYTTHRRVWEHDGEFKDYLRRTRAMAIDMETATIFAAGFANRLPTGALMLVSDVRMIMSSRWCSLAP